MCGALICVTILPTSSINAQIQLVGLEHDKSLTDYITQKALAPYKEDPKKNIRFAKVKSEIVKALNAKGYYAPKVTYKDNGSNIFQVNAGKQYTVHKIDISGYDGFTAPTLKERDVLDARAVLDEQKNILNVIREEQCFYRLSVKHEIVLNHLSKTAHVKFIVQGDNDAKFGETEFTGGETIERKYLSRFLNYKEGECWSARKLEATKADLLETGLLSSVDAALPEAFPQSKTIPVTFVLKERAPRKIRLGGKYSTSEGPGVSAEWRHNNYFGSGEKISLITKASALLQSVGVDFSKPFFVSKKQSLHSSITAEREDSDAFEETSLNIHSSIHRKLSKNWNGNIGIALEASTIKEDQRNEETFGLVSFPSSVNFDNRDNPLDPHKGYSFNMGMEPFVDSFGQSDPFFKSRVSGTTYFDLSRSSWDPVLALRGSYGSMLGSDTDSIPASKRFYAGGGNSIRGFGFQEAGPLDTDGEPLGGRSLVETNAELRLKFTETIGGVAFVDAGGTYNDVTPDFKEGLFVGAGIGARYYTSFGPIRFDVAVPVNKKEHTDQRFQVYISIGQAF